MHGVVHLEIPPRRDHLAMVRMVVTAASIIDGRFGEQRIDDLCLAVSEACANAFDALQGDSTPVRLRIEGRSDGLSVTVEDAAGGFDLAALEAIPAATEPGRLRHERGLGIPLMRSLVDEVSFAGTQAGTTVRLLVRPPAA